MKFTQLYFPYNNFQIIVLEIKIKNFLLPQILVFWKNTLLEFENKNIIDACPVSETEIDLKTQDQNGNLTYYRFDTEKRKALKIKYYGSEITESKEEGIKAIQKTQKELWEDENLEYVYTTKENE